MVVDEGDGDGDGVEVIDPPHLPPPPPPPGGISRPRAPPRGLGAVNSPVGLVTGHPGTAAQSGPAGKAARTVGRRPGEALTQPNPTPLPQWLLKALGPQFATARKAGPIPWSAQVLEQGCAGDQPVFSSPPA